MIRRLRDLGMPLEQIAAVVHAHDVESANAAIAAHLRRMEDQLEETRATVESLRTLGKTFPSTRGRLDDLAVRRCDVRVLYARSQRRWLACSGAGRGVPSAGIAALRSGYIVPVALRRGTVAM